MINITININAEYEFILAKELGYNENISTDNGIISNPETPGEFICNVLKEDWGERASKLIIAYNDRKKQAIYDAEDQAVKNEVLSNITSQII